MYTPVNLTFSYENWGKKGDLYDTEYLWRQSEDALEN